MTRTKGDQGAHIHDCSMMCVNVARTVVKFYLADTLS